MLNLPLKRMLCNIHTHTHTHHLQHPPLNPTPPPPPHPPPHTHTQSCYRRSMSFDPAALCRRGWDLLSCPECEHGFLFFLCCKHGRQCIEPCQFIVYCLNTTNSVGLQLSSHQHVACDFSAVSWSFSCSTEPSSRHTVKLEYWKNIQKAVNHIICWRKKTLGIFGVVSKCFELTGSQSLLSTLGFRWIISLFD